MSNLPVTLHKKIRVKAPAKKVFAYWSDFRHFQKFIPMIESIEILDEQRSRWLISAPLGHRVLFESVITTFEPDRILVWESSHADGHARGEVILFEEGEYTLVELNYEYSLYAKWMQQIARLVSHFGFPSHAFDLGLAHIKEEIEKEATK